MRLSPMCTPASICAKVAVSLGVLNCACVGWEWLRNRGKCLFFANTCGRAQGKGLFYLADICMVFLIMISAVILKNMSTSIIVSCSQSLGY